MEEARNAPTYAPSPVSNNAVAPAPVTQQPMYMVPQQKQPQVVNTRQNTRGWNSDMWSCFEDMESSFLGCCCFPIMSCTVAKRLDENCCVPLFLQGGLMAVRTKLRMQLGIQGSICDDWCMTCCCPLLALCQMDRELKKVGVN